MRAGLGDLVPRRHNPDATMIPRSSLCGASSVTSTPSHHIGCQKKRNDIGMLGNQAQNAPRQVRTIGIVSIGCGQDGSAALGFAGETAEPNALLPAHPSRSLSSHDLVVPNQPVELGGGLTRAAQGICALAPG